MRLDLAGISRVCSWISLPALLLFAASVSAAWVGVCPQESDGLVMAEYQDPAGARQWLMVSETPLADCSQMEVDLPAKDIRWAGLVPDDVADRLDGGVSLVADRDSQMSAVSEVIPTQAETAPVPVEPPALAIGENILHQWQAQQFGDAQRVEQQQSESGIALVCRPGQSPAGLRLSTGQKLLPPGSSLTAVLAYQSGEDFLLTLAGDQTETTAPAPQRASSLLSATAEPARVEIVLPVADRQLAWTIDLVCPEQGGSAKILSLELQPRGPVLTQRSTWIWNADRVVQSSGELIAQLRAAQIELVFVAVRMTGTPNRLSEPEALAEFIEAAASAGIDVWIVEGDPNAISASGRPFFLQRTAALAKFNAAQPPTRRFSGVQYDIEPYLVPGFDLHRNAWLRAYLKTLAELRAQLDVPMEVAVPFWWEGLRVDGEPILAEMVKLVSGVTVMNYRTDPQQLLELARPFLRWGAEQDRYVRIALESVPLPDQTLWNFRRGERGRLWHLELGSQQALLLLNRPVSNPFGATFHRSYSVEVPASGTTFDGRRQKLDAALPGLAFGWSAWQSFAGTALHGYIE